MLYFWGSYTTYSHWLKADEFCKYAESRLTTLIWHLVTLSHMFIVLLDDYPASSLWCQCASWAWRQKVMHRIATSSVDSSHIDKAVKDKACGHFFFLFYLIVLWLWEIYFLGFMSYIFKMWKILSRIKKGELYQICPAHSIVAISLIKLMCWKCSRIKICVFIYMKKKSFITLQ